MNITVIKGSNLTPELADTWSTIHASAPGLASPYFSPGFTSAVAAVRDDVYVAVIREGMDIIGFFPFQRNPMGIGEPVAGSFSDFHGTILRQGRKVDALELITRCGLKLWDFDHLPADQESFRPFQKRIDISRFMDLSEGYANYCAQRRRAGSEQIPKALGLKRKFEREVGNLNIKFQDQNIGLLNLLFERKSRQYLAAGWRDSFAFAWTKRLLQTILETQTEGISGMLSALYVKNEVAAVHFGMRSRSVWHYWFPAYDTKFAKYSPGLILLLGMAEKAPSLGIKRIDLGKGDELYKQRLATGGIPVMEGSVERASAAVIARRMLRNTRQRLEGTVVYPPARFVFRKLLRLKAKLLRE